MSDDPSSETTGGRLVARLLGRSNEGADYALELSADGHVWSGRASVADADGRVELRSEPSTLPAPAWLERLVLTTLRGAWQRHRAGSGWPRRVARWRPSSEPEGAKGAP